MSLESRIADFGVLSGRFPCDKPSPLIAVHRIREDLWQGLRMATLLYMSRCLPGAPVIVDETELMERFVRQRGEIPNITPNGMIVPKRHTILEYNLLVRAFARVIDSLGIEDLVLSWHIPLNLRIKLSQPSAENLRRHHPTEHIHSDSWAGESNESVTTHLPLLGDTERNHLVFYDPPADFQEEWLRPLPSYADGAGIAARYSPIAFVARKGTIVLADFAGLHASSRRPGAQARVTIDTTFHLHRRRLPDQEEIIHPWRVDERAPHRVLAGLGETHLFVFPDDVNRWVDSQGGFKHPSHLEIIELLKPAE